jgi:hypothetical protein
MKAFVMLALITPADVCGWVAGWLGGWLAGHALIVWPMKIIKVHMQNNEPGWYPPPGEDATTTKYTLTEMGLCPYPPPAVASWAPCNVSFCLFNVSADPCEHHNLADEPGMAVRTNRKEKKTPPFCCCRFLNEQSDRLPRQARDETEETFLKHDDGFAGRR